MLLLLFFSLSAIVPLVQGACSWNDTFVLPLMTSLIAQDPVISAEASSAGTLQITITRTIGTGCSAAPFTGVIGYTATVTGIGLAPFIAISSGATTYNTQTTGESSILTFAQFFVPLATQQAISVVSLETSPTTVTYLF